MKTRLRLFALVLLLVGVSNVISGKRIALKSESDLAESRSATELPINVDISGDYLLIDIYGVLGNATVQITTAGGQLVYSDPSFATPQQGSIYLSDLDAGDYVLKIIFPYATIVGEFSVE